jgi:hypothetical protein
MASVRSAQTSVAIAYAITWPDPKVRSAQTTAAVAYAIPWPDPKVRAVQTTVAVLYDPSPPPSGGDASVSMLCQIIG